MTDTPTEALGEAIYRGTRRDPDDAEIVEALAELERRGFVLMPVQPPDDVLKAFNSYAQCIGDDVRGYAAMIAARPR